MADEGGVRKQEQGLRDQGAERGDGEAGDVRVEGGTAEGMAAGV
ncbi:MAG: hypothetical protein JWQ43_4009 [Glaciihabitans sp.]|nr:hypothetical protein [Glaciihabitans sp.]